LITYEMVNKMDERRRWKNASTEEGKNRYKMLNKELQKETNKARENWWIKECE